MTRDQDREFKLRTDGKMGDYSRRSSGDYSRRGVTMADYSRGEVTSGAMADLSGLLDELAGRVHIEVAMTWRVSGRW